MMTGLRTFALAAAFAVAGFLFYFLLRSSEAPRAAKVVEPQKKEVVKPAKEEPKNTEKK